MRIWVEVDYSLPVGVGAKYVPGQNGGRQFGTVKIRSDATHYEMEHELHHALHHIDIGDKFHTLNLAQKEGAVYRRLKSSPAWKTYTQDMKDDAYTQLTQRFRDGSVGPEFPPAGLE